MTSFYNQTVKVHSSLLAVPLEDLCTLFDTIMRCFESVCIIVDGLDECEDQENVVAEHLARLGSDDERVRSLFFSRRTERLERVLVTDYKYSPQQVAANDGDIRAYVEAEVETRIDNGELSVGDENLKSKVCEALVDGAQGM